MTFGGAHQPEKKLLSEPNRSQMLIMEIIKGEYWNKKR